MATQQPTVQPTAQPPQSQAAPRPVILAEMNPPPTFAGIFAVPTIQLMVWLNNVLLGLANPISAVIPNTNTFQAAPNSPYTSARTGPFGQGPTNVLINNQRATVEREKLLYSVHNGDVNRYRPVTNERSISPALPGDAMIGNAPNPACWLYLTGGVVNTTTGWMSLVNTLLTKTDGDCRNYGKRPAQMVWRRASPTAGDIWHQFATVLNVLPYVMLRLVQDANNQARCVKWLLGDRVRPHLDVDALYTPGATYFVPDPTQNNNLRDLVSVLRDWLEHSCAFMLAECFMCDYVGNGGAAFKAAWRENLKYLARVNPNRRFLEAGVADFPYRP